MFEDADIGIIISLAAKKKTINRETLSL